MTYLLALLLAAAHPPTVEMDATFEDFCIADEYPAIITEDGVRHACPESFEEMAADPRCTVDREPICPEAEERAILCRGPVEDIPDDDPGLALFEGSLEDRRAALDDERTNACADEERG